MTLKIIEKPVDKLIPYARNARTHSTAQVSQIAASIKEFGFNNPVLIDGESGIIAGHGRVLAAQKLGLEKVPTISLAHLNENQKRAFILADNKLALNAGWDLERLKLELDALKSADFDLSLTGFDVEELSNISGGYEGKTDPDKMMNSKLKTLAAAEEYVKNHDEILVQFSGGKDSTIALKWVAGVSDRLGKKIRAFFVETGAEFPDMAVHVHRICERLGISLTVLRPEKNIITSLMDTGEWPDPIWRDCIGKFINEPLNKLIIGQTGNILVVRGGRKNQKTSRSKSDIYLEIKVGKGLVKILNPFFYSSAEDYELAMSEAKALMWAGYNNGFVRTACWLCPFQKPEQWEALRISYPLLWNQMAYLYGKLKFKEYKGDGNLPRLKKYWEAMKHE